jgi:PAS domain S-box-containing protein
MNAMGEGLAVVDCNNKFTYINPTLSHMMDIKPEDWVGKKLDQELFQEDPVALSELQTKVHKGDQYRYELRHVHQNGSILPVLITATPNTLNGEFDGYIAVLTDLTEEARIREAAMIARDQALTAARLRAEFIARLSHELRTPMNGILGMAELLSESGLTPEQREMSDTVYECGQSLMYLINDLLDFSKIEAGKMQLDISHFEVVTVINAVLKLLGAKAQAKGLYVKTQIESLVPRFLIGDANRLRQILTNLVGNAIKFTEHGGVYIKVSKIEITSVHAHDLVKPAYYGAVTVSNTLPIWLRFEVIDSGIGLAEPMRKNLFQPFIQGDMSITRKYGGTGLGLAICKNLVGLMNGDIGVTSTEGKGSTFWFTAQFGSSDRHLN